MCDLLERRTGPEAVARRAKIGFGSLRQPLLQM
jgi:hypothetical protein